MSNRELPMMPWYPDQFAASTTTWSYAERCAYRALLDIQWALAVLPNEPWRLAHAIGASLEEFEAVWPVVSQKFESVEGGLRNARLEAHRLAALKFHKKKAAAGRLGGLSRSRQAQLKQNSSNATSLLEAKLKPLSLSPINKTLPPYPPSRKRAADGQGGRGAPERGGDGALREDDPEVQRKRREAETLAAQHAKPPDDGMPF